MRGAVPAGRGVEGDAGQKGVSDMRDVRNDVQRWFSAGKAVALAQVVKTWGSSPRACGSVMAVNEDGGIAGSVSGGCIEGSVVQTALDCLGGMPARLEKFHASTARAQEVGLSCGGNVEVLVGALDRTLFEVECGELDADRAYVRVCLMEAAGAAADGRGTDVADGRDASARARQAAPGTCLLLVSAASPAAMGRAGLRPHPVPGQDGWRLLAPREAEEALSSGTLAEVAAQVLAVPATEVAGHVRHAAGDFFFCRTNPLPKLVCVGGVHVSIHLTRMAKMLGYHTVVIDPRGAFATGERFPFVDQLVHAWPQEAFKSVVLDEATALCALTHDPKIDVPALAAALDSPAFYIGSLGRHTTQLSRYRQLVCEGYGDDAIARVFGPIGLDLKGREPAEIALAIMSEITAVRYGGSFPMATMLQSARRAEAERAAAR